MALQKQRGLVMPLVAISMISLIAMAGLVMDLGHLYLNKTRLQNAADAAALSAAQTLDVTHKILLANAAGKHTFNNAINQELVDANLRPIFTYSEKIQPFIDTTDTAQHPVFVRVVVSGFSQKNFLLPIIGINTLLASATAVAGPSLGLNKVCNAVPLVACGDSDSALNNFGFVPDKVYSLKTGTDINDNWGVTKNGTYQNIQLDCGTSDDYDCIGKQVAGQYAQCLTIGDTINTVPPDDFSANSDGINTRLDCPEESCGAFGSDDNYPSDKVTVYPYTMTNYQADYTTQNFSRTGIQYKELRRIIVMPVVDCSTTTNGSGNLLILGLGCFFLTEPSGNDANGQQTIYAQYLENCLARGKMGVDPILKSGPHTIILYRDITGNLDS
ncbi:MAG: Tad domain-containing protein [Methylococcaceae bacterium]